MHLVAGFRTYPMSFYSPWTTLESFESMSENKIITVESDKSRLNYIV